MVCLLVLGFGLILHPRQIWGVGNLLEGPPLVLGQGEQRLVRFEGLKRYSLGSPIVRAVSLSSDPDRLLLKGIQVGITDLWVWKQDGSTERRFIEVRKVDRREKPTRLEQALSRLQETEVYYSDQGAVLRGEIQSLGELARIQSLQNSYPKEILNETEIGPQLLALGKKRIEAWIFAHPEAAELSVETLGQGLWVSGHIARARARQEIERQLRALFPAIQLDLESLPDDSPTIFFRVFLLEIRKAQFGRLGIDWPGSVSGAFKASTWGIREAIALDLALQALEGEGSAKILSRPELVVRAPGEAELFAGGELPIRTKSPYSSNVTWKPFGLTLKLKVTHATRERVRVDILTEVSSLNPDISDSPIPGIHANRMKTQVDARFGSPLFLSGLLQEGARETARGLPLLGKIPVLGALFSSEDYLNERSELVAVLLPLKAPPAAPMDRMSQSDRKSPAGPVPPPRNWVSPEEERRLRRAASFPWNALQ